DAHDKLHMRPLVQQALIGEAAGRVEVGEVKHLDFRLDSVFPHLGGKVLYEGRVIFVDDTGEIDRSSRQRGHVRLQKERAAPLTGIPSPSSGRKLYDHAGAMAPDPIVHSGKALRVRRWSLVVIAHVDMR